MAPWFALTVAPRKEKVTAQTLRAEGFDEFLPLCSSTRRWSDRIKRLENPLFPGYVFCRFDLRDRQAVLKTPGVVSLKRDAYSINWIPTFAPAPATAPPTAPTAPPARPRA